MFWAEVPVAEFVVAVCTIVMVHMAARTAIARSGSRDWLRIARGRG